MKTLALPALLVLTGLLVVPLAAAQEFEDAVTDPADDALIVAGRPVDLGHIDILAATARLSGSILEATLTLNATPPVPGEEDFVNYQILFDRINGTAPGFPPSMEWDLSIVCLLEAAGVRCEGYGANITVLDGFFDGATLRVRADMNGTFADRLIVGAAASMARSAQNDTFSALDATPNIDFTTPDEVDPDDGGIQSADGKEWYRSAWVLPVALVAGVTLGYIWKKRLDRADR